jgi:hypothetical protein
MAKRSVYIPDGLWSEIQDQVHGLNLSVSEIVQTALRQAFSTTRAHAPTPNDAFKPRHRQVDAETLDRLRDRFQKQAQAAYDEGHRYGSDIAGRVSWGELATLARSNWRHPRKEGDTGWDAYQAVLKEPWGPDWGNRLKDDAMASRGVTDALQEIFDYATADRSEPPT